MKYIFLSLIMALPITSFSASSIMTEEEYRRSSYPEPPYPYTDLPARMKSIDDCGEGCNAKTFKELIAAKDKEYDKAWSFRNAFLEAEAKKDDKKALEYEVELGKADARYRKLLLIIQLNRLQYAEEKLKEKLNQSSLELAQCKGTTKEKDSLVVDDSNRSFFNKISEIFSWKRDTPAPVEDRSTGLSK